MHKEMTYKLINCFSANLRNYFKLKRLSLPFFIFKKLIRFQNAIQVSGADFDNEHIRHCALLRLKERR